MRIQRLCVLGTAALLALPAAAQQQQQQPPQQQQEQQSQQREGPKWPQDPQARRRLERQLETGELGPLPAPVLAGVTYLVTFMSSDTTFPLRSATMITVTNSLNNQSCQATVHYFRGLDNSGSASCSSSYNIPPDLTVDFCSRIMPLGLHPQCDAFCWPQLTDDVGRAWVMATCDNIGVSARVYYTQDDDELRGISDSKIVRVIGEGVFWGGNIGD
jgi:hypothetical protein